jgi:hypothetical protein
VKAASPALAFEERATRPTCPRCESLEVVPLVFGLPTPELCVYAETTGKVALGGCVIFWDYHRWNYHACDLEF